MSQNKNGMTVQEFRYWLEGVEEMQVENWTPNAVQWKRIREKLDTIVEQSIPVQQPTTVYRNPDILPEQHIPYAGPVQLAQPGLQRIVPAAPAPNNALFGNADNPQNPVKTPNVDTSTGEYASAFL